MTTQYPIDVRAGVFITQDCWDIIFNQNTITVSEDTVASPLPMRVEELNLGNTGVGYIIVTTGYSTVSTSETMSIDKETINYFSELIIA